MQEEPADFGPVLERLREQWDSSAAREAAAEIVTAIWQAGGTDEDARRRAVELRRMLKARLSAAPASAEQFALSNILYSLEQGLGNREEALALARRAEELSREVASPLERVESVFQMAKAMLYVDRNEEAVRWSQQGLLLGDRLEEAAVGGTDAALGAAGLEILRRLLADQESRLVNRMATLGGMNAEVDRAADSAVARWRRLGDASGLAGALGMIVEARVFQGRWEEAARRAREALEAVGYPRKDPGIAYALCFGALALCRLGEAQTARTWTADAESISREAGNHECVLEARAVGAVARACLGQSGEALTEIDEVVRETEALNMGELTRWVVGQRAWIRMNAGAACPPEELLEAARYLFERSYHVQGAEVLYAAACALRLAGRDHRRELDEAVTHFERFGMTWHLDLARRQASPFDAGGS